MKAKLMMLLAVIAATPVGAQTPRDRLMMAAKAFHGQADACLFDVRDKSRKFEESVECKRLGAFHFHYVESGGGRPETPAEIELVAAQGRTTAWMAKAISESGEGPFTKIW